MKTVGLFEAKTKLSELCDEVARTGASVLITRRGKPLVRLDPLPRDLSSVWDDRDAFLSTHGLEEEFDVPARSRELPTQIPE